MSFNYFNLILNQTIYHNKNKIKKIMCIYIYLNPNSTDLLYPLRADIQRIYCIR